MNNNLIVTKSNWLIEASYKLTLEEQRLVLICVAKIDSRREAPDEVTITALEYAEMFNIDPTNAYRQLETATTSLYDRDIKIHDEINKKLSRMRWVSSIDYHYGSGKVTLCFSNRVKNYIGKLQEQFTSYKLQQVSDLKSSYSIRFFELLQQFIKTGNRTIEINWLREYLGLKEKYPKFKSLKQWVINPSIKELIAKTNLTIEYKTVKQGRRVHAIEFTFLDYSTTKKKAATKKPITPEEYAAIHPKKTRGKTTKEVIDMMQNNK